MATIRVRNIAPLKDTETLNLTSVMLFIGMQSTGKSTLMKILCFCRWIEKRVMVDGEELLYKYTHYNRFRKELMKFHRLNEAVFTDESKIEYNGDCVTIELSGRKSNVKIQRKKNFAQCRHNAKLCFIPAERNLLSAISNIDKNYKATDMDVLFNYILEWGEAREQFTSNTPLNLVIDPNMAYYYDEKKGDVLKLNREQRTIGTFYASSGVQSALPVAVLANYIGGLIGTNGKKSPMDYMRALSRYLSTDEEGRIEITSENLASVKQLLLYKSIQLYIEEPEQNLFPKSQSELVKEVVRVVKKAMEATDVQDSSVVMTTHSPYVLTALNVMLATAKAFERNPEKTMVLMGKENVMAHDRFSAYYINREGLLQNLIDEETGLIMGEYLDSVSEEVDETMFLLNEIIYADAD